MRKLSLALMCFIAVFNYSAVAEAEDIKFSGTYDIQYRRGDSYRASGNDQFKIMDLYFQINPMLADNVEGLLKLDGADFAKETTKASHKYVDEAQIIFKDVADLPLTIVYGKDEMPFGQDYDKSLFDPIVHQLEIDKVWGLNAGYKFSSVFKFEAGIWEQDATKNLSIYESYTARVKASPGKNLTVEVSYANIGSTPTIKDENRINAGLIYKWNTILFYGEYPAFKNSVTQINGYNMGKSPVLLTVGAELRLGSDWKLKARYESLDDDSSIDTILGAFHTGVDYKIGEKTALMFEYQNILGEGSAKDKRDISVGVLAKF